MSTAANVGLFREDVFLAAGAPLLAVTPEHIAPANGVFYPMGGDGLGDRGRNRHKVVGFIIARDVS